MEREIQEMSWAEVSVLGLVLAAGGTVTTASGFGPLDIHLMMFLTLLTSAASAGLRWEARKFRSLTSFFVNVALGFVFGILFAHFICVVANWPPMALLSLAPILAAISAKVARQVITDDETLNKMAGIIVSKLWRK